MRCFVALEVPESLKKYYSERLSLVKQSFTGNVVKVSQMHITLFFFSNINQEHVKNISITLNQVCEAGAFDVKLGAGKFFSKNGNPFAFYVEVISGGLKNLRNNLALSLGEIWNDCRPFIPHLTIVRIKKMFDAGMLSQFLKSFMSTTYSAETIKFIKSDLKDSGPVYTVLNEFNLKKIRS